MHCVCVACKKLATRYPLCWMWQWQCATVFHMLRCSQIVVVVVVVFAFLDITCFDVCATSSAVCRECITNSEPWLCVHLFFFICCKFFHGEFSSHISWRFGSVCDLLSHWRWSLFELDGVITMVSCTLSIYAQTCTNFKLSVVI